MIATDAPNVLPEEHEEEKQEEEESKKKKKKIENPNRKGDKEYGVSRGIDFYRVANIINFDFPMDFDSYVHRVGRTARVDQKGIKNFSKIKNLKFNFRFSTFINNSKRNSIF